MDLSTMYESACKIVLTPEPFRHKPIQFGPRERTIKEKRVLRTDIKIESCRGTTIEGFLFCEESLQADELILYLHGSGGSKLDSLPMLDSLPKHKYALAAMDFAGCGNSQFEQLTYGHHEAEDVKIFLEEVKRIVGVKSVTLWGRSMGAVTAIMFAHRYQALVQGLILDGPFRRLEGVVYRVARETMPQIPKPFLDGFLFLLKRKVNSQLNLGFCLFEFDYVRLMSELDSKMAVLFIYSNFDTMVPTQQTFEFYNAFKGTVKDTYEIFYAHNEERPRSVFEEALKWLKRSKPVGAKNKSGLHLNSLKVLDGCEYIHLQRLDVKLTPTGLPPLKH